MKKWQREVIERYEQVTAFDVIGKDRIHDDKSFWEVWDHNIRWFESVCCEVQTIINSYSHLRPE